MPNKQEDNEIGVLLDNTPADVKISINKLVFEELLNDKFTAYFKDYKDDISQLYAFYISIAKDLQVKKSFKTFMRFFINYIDKNNIKVHFKRGIYGTNGLSILSKETLTDFVDALTEAYSNREFTAETYTMSDLWRDTHLSLQIKKSDTLKKVFVFRDKIVKENEKIMKAQHDDAMKAVVEFGKTLQGIPHADDEIQRILDTSKSLKKHMSKYLSRTTIDGWRHDIHEFENDISYIYVHLENLKFLLDAYLEDPTNNDLLLWMEDNIMYSDIILQVHAWRH
jgi:hypothetical protein